MKNIALREKETLTNDEQGEAHDAEKFSSETLKKFLRDKVRRLQTLPDDQKYGLLVCAECR